MSEVVVEERPDEGRFVSLRDGEEVGAAMYSEHDGVVTIPHVETRPDLRGYGIGDLTMAGVLDLLDASGRTIRPTCSFAAGHVHERPARHHLLAR